MGPIIIRGVTSDGTLDIHRMGRPLDGRRSTLAGIIGAREPDGNELMRSGIEIERSPAFQMPACDI